MGRKVLLGCGIVSSLLYVGAGVVGARRWSGYSLASHTVSELSAIGAPSRPVVIPLLTAHGALVIPFGVGVLEVGPREQPPDFARHRLRGHGVRKAVSPLLDRDHPGARRDRRSDRYPGVPSGGQPADPWAGVTERISIGGYLLWQVVLAIALMRMRASRRLPRQV